MRELGHKFKESRHKLMSKMRQLPIMDAIFEGIWFDSKFTRLYLNRRRGRLERIINAQIGDQ